ncbi:MAG: TIGR03905 family TSCPD domain-containing protein [Acutalibacteraceae bacterium]
MIFSYRPTGTCSRAITLDMDGTKVKSLSFTGGCNGNGKGIASLCEGMEAQEIIKRCKGIDCGGRGTSCPDQLARALEAYLEEF